MGSSRHYVHGLADDEVAAYWPALTAAEVDALLARFPRLAGPTRVAWHSPRPLSAAALVATAGGRVFVKRHHLDVRTPAALAEEHALIAYLRAHGAPIPEVLADREGQTAIRSGHWVYEVHAEASGVDLYRDTPSWTPLADLARAHTAGRMLARLHAAAANYAAPQRSTWILVTRDDLLVATDFTATLAAQLPRRPALAAYLAARPRPWRVELAPIAARQRVIAPRLRALRRLWTHNDWHASNLCWASPEPRAEVAAILDFGLASPTFALFDLATAIERNAIAWLHLECGAGAVFPDTALALIAGYAEQAPLSGADRALVAELLPLVHVGYALSETEYFFGVTQSQADADVAFDTFLRGHFRWFGTDPGRSLLAAIRDA